jgi:hypothetical protein
MMMLNDYKVIFSLAQEYQGLILHPVEVYLLNSGKVWSEVLSVLAEII